MAGPLQINLIRPMITNDPVLYQRAVKSSEAPLGEKKGASMLGANTTGILRCWQQKSPTTPRTVWNRGVVKWREEKAARNGNPSLLR